MNVGGGEAADQVVRMMLSGTEVAVRLGGSALKNMLALTLALAKNRKKVSGKLNLRKMLRETRDLRRFPMTPKQYKKFKKLAKKYKLLYSVVRDKDGHGKIKDVILPVTELDRANAIFDRILYTTPPEPEMDPARPLQQGREVFEPERQAPARERQAPAPERQAVARERQVPTPEQQAPEKVRPTPVRERRDGPEAQQQEGTRTPKKDSRSERGSNATKASSATSKGSRATTPDKRPSVEGRLKAYKAQLVKKPVPARAREITKNRPRIR